MKKVLTVLVVMAMCFSFVSGVQAATATTTAAATDQTAVTKLGRGLLNVVAAVFEIPTTMMQENEKDGMGAALTKGPVLGVVNTVLRALAGVYEVATFPVPIPEGYEPIMESPTILGKDM